MPTFTLTGAEDPFLHIALRNGESIACESDAMVMMEDTLGLTGRVQGGIMQAVMRKFANGESFFQQQIKATRGDGDCLLGAQLPGAMEVLDVGRIQYRINDGAYVASTEGVAVTARMQGVGNALFGASGGFFVGETSGQGQVVVAGFGSVFSLDVDPRKDMLIDNGHVVAWDAKLHYEVSASTNRSQGLLGNLVNSVTSGEGLVLRFSGVGKVVICSRNRSGFVSWMRQQVQAR